MIEREIQEYAIKKQKSGLLFPSLIIRIYAALKAEITSSDERIKNESILTVWTIKRITR